MPTSWTRSRWPSGFAASARSNTRLMISRIRSVCSSARFGVNARCTSAFRRSWRGGSCVISMLSTRSIGSGVCSSQESLSTTTMLRLEEKVAWSRPTVAMSAKRTTDQKPISCGNASSGLQCSPSIARIRANSSCGGPSRHRSRLPRSCAARSDVGAVKVVILLSSEKVACRCRCCRGCRSGSGCSVGADRRLAIRANRC